MDKILKKKSQLKSEINKNEGILRLIPSWVSRNTLPPGKRLKLDNRDLYIRGAERGAISERWLASTGEADNGELTTENEGLSFIAIEGGKEKILLKDAIEIMGDEIIGEDVMQKYGGLTVFAKFYDFSCAIPHHVHLLEKDAKLAGVNPKPEAYYFPRQLNSISYKSSYSYFGLEPGTTREDVINCLKNWGKTEGNEIIELSKAYKLKLCTGWNIPAGILHAPGSLLTYEPQRVSDVSLFFQSMVDDRYMDRSLLVKFIPKEKHYDFDYLVDVLDWEANVDQDFKKNHFIEPVPVDDIEEMHEKGYEEYWISYGSNEFSAKELTIFPGRSVTIKDDSAYGLIMLEGYGVMNNVEIETPAIIRFNEVTSDEFYVTRQAANKGVTIKNLSKFSRIVMLKHFGPENKDSKKINQN